MSYPATLQKKTHELVGWAREVLLASSIAVTVRQCFYQLVVRHLIENSKPSYRRLVHALAEGRKAGLIPWDCIEDRLRKPRSVAMWDSVQDFSDSVVLWYCRDIWATQPNYLHVWLEKDALSGGFEDVLTEYGVTLNVGRGYDGWSSIYETTSPICREPESSILYVVENTDFNAVYSGSRFWEPEWNQEPAFGERKR